MKFTIQKGNKMKILIAILLITAMLSAGACHHFYHSPSHDPYGPGNSENAPGHDPDGPGNSENAPGHNKY